LRRGLAYLAPRCYEMTGYAPDEVTPDLDFFKCLVHPEDRVRVLGTMEAHLAGKSGESVFDYRIVTKSGAVKWVQGKGKIVERAADGAPLRMVGTISDITERKRKE
jgi:PAS domain S-box-containing protein